MAFKNCETEAQTRRKKKVTIKTVGGIHTTSSSHGDRRPSEFIGGKVTGLRSPMQPCLAVGGEGGVAFSGGHFLEANRRGRDWENPEAGSQPSDWTWVRLFEARALFFVQTHAGSRRGEGGEEGGREATHIHHYSSVPLAAVYATKQQRRKEREGIAKEGRTTGLKDWRERERGTRRP